MEIEELVSALTNINDGLVIAVHNVEDEQGRPLRQWKLFASIDKNGEFEWNSTYICFKNVNNPYVFKRKITPIQALNWIMALHKSVKIVYYNGM